MNPSTTISVTSHLRADPRGLTLLELLIALAVVLAIGALALPFTYREFERRESVALREQIRMQAVMARARARSEGVPYAMKIDQTGSLIEVFSLDPRDPGNVVLEEDEAMDTAAEDAQVVAAVEPWMVVKLPSGTRLAEMMDEEETAFDSFEDLIEPAEEDALQEGDANRLAGVRLAVFLPDGTLLGGRECILSGPAGRFRVDFDAWTARMHFQTLNDQARNDETFIDEAESLQ